MKIAYVLNMVAPVNEGLKHDILFEKINGKSPLEVLIEKIKSLPLKNIGDEDRAFYIVGHSSLINTSGKYLEGLNVVPIKNGDVKDTLLELYGAVKGYDAVVHIMADEPLIDTGVISRLVETHKSEMAEYTYGEGYLPGIAPEIISVDLIPKLVKLYGDGRKPIRRNTIFEILSKDINSFDIEIVFAPEDMRLLRVELNLSKKINRELVRRIIDKLGFNPSYQEICGLIKKDPWVIRTIPSYIEIEISSALNGPVPYIPSDSIRRKRGMMPLDVYKKVLDEISPFVDVAYVSVSYLGEPLLNPEIKEIIATTVNSDKFNLILETDGIMVTPDFSDFLVSLEAGEKLKVIFQLDAIKKETYMKIHGTDIKYPERNLRYFASRFSGGVYAQFVRMDMNEDEMIDFYRSWKNEGIDVIIQKYNDYLGLLPELSTVDLKPLEKICCYHLMREIAIFSNGDVPRCRQDVEGIMLVGNILDHGFSDVWEKIGPYFRDHCAGKYDSYCKKCDEYYIFNF